MSAQKTVLLVDDDTDIIESMRTVLEGRGYRVMVARDGNAGLTVAERENPDLIVIADCITSYGVAELRPAAWGVDVIVSGSQKGTATPPGLGFVLFSPEVQERMIAAPRRGFYLDLTRELKGQKAGNTPQTPAINLISALSVALDRLLAVPLEVLWAEKRRQADALIAAGTAMFVRGQQMRDTPTTANRALTDTAATDRVTGDVSSALATVFSYAPGSCRSANRWK